MHKTAEEPQLAAVVPTLGRDTLLKTLESLAKATRFEDLEVFVCGKIRDKSVSTAVGKHCEAHRNVRHLDIEYPQGDSSRKKNEGARLASAPVVAFLDDDVVVPQDWVDQTLRSFVDEKVGLVSGPSLVPDDTNLVGRLAGMALSSPAAGYVANRYLNGDGEMIPAKWSDIIGCNMAYRKDVLVDIGMFDPGYWPGEEMIAAFRTEKAGWRLIFNSAARVYHYPRQSLSRFWRQIWGYGATRIRLMRGGAEFEPSTIVPGVWVLSLFVLGASAFFHPLAAWLLLIDLLLYAFFSAWITVGMVRRSGDPRDVLLFLMIPYMHLSYGLAEWAELFFPNKDLSERV